MNRKLVLAAVVLGGLTVASLGLPISNWVHEFSLFLQNTGFEGRVAFLASYFVVTIFPLPLFPFTVLAGFVYGFRDGYLMTMPVALLGSAIGVVLGGSILKQSVRDYVSKRPAWAAVVAAMCAASTRAVVLARLAPTMPFSIQNYVLGAVGVSLKPMLVGTLIAIQPILGTGLYIGGLITNMAEMHATGASSEISNLRLFMLVVGGCALFSLVGWLSLVAKRALADFK